MLSERRGGPALFFVLPFFIAVLRPAWFHSWVFARDPWLYYGYFENGVDYLRRFRQFYWGSRLGGILPGFIVHHLTTGEAANLILRFALFWAAVFSFYFLIRELFGPRVALWSGIAFSLHPFFLQAVGSDYVDGFGITYFLAALYLVARAARSDRAPLLLAAAGALAMAMVSSNVFYAILVPIIGALFLFLRRVSIGKALVYGAVGAGAVFLFFCIFTRAAGGPFFFLQPSFTFGKSAVAAPNKFRDPWQTWLPYALWLVFPLSAFISAVVLLTRRSLTKIQKFAQWQLILFVLFMAALQIVGNGAMLQYFFYVSLVVPCGFLALAGQLSYYDRDTSAVAILALQAIPIFAPLLPWKLAVLPLGVALLLGLAMVVALHARRATLLAVFMLLAASQFVVRQHAHPFVRREQIHAREYYLQVDAAVHAIDRYDPSRAIRLWYNSDSPSGIAHDMIGSAFLLCPRMINKSFPRLDAPVTCDAQPLTRGLSIAIISDDPDPFAKARAAIAKHGFGLQLRARETIPGPEAVNITYVVTQ